MFIFTIILFKNCIFYKLNNNIPAIILHCHRLSFYCDNDNEWHFFFYSKILCQKLNKAATLTKKTHVIIINTQVLSKLQTKKNQFKLLIKILELNNTIFCCKKKIYIFQEILVAPSSLTYYINNKEPHSKGPHTHIRVVKYYFPFLYSKAQVHTTTTTRVAHPLLGIQV